jgi:hypothetical protein
MNIPNTWKDLEEFTQWYIDNVYPMRVPENVRIWPTDFSYSATIFRQDVYQVEIYLARENFTSSRHTHPFEQKIIFLGGNFKGTRPAKNGNIVSKVFGSSPNENMDNELPGKDAFDVASILKPGEWHQIESGQQGFIFLNLQKWPSKEIMDSAVVHYGGESLGPEHDKIKYMENT